jgi:hypothetical protein
VSVQTCALSAKETSKWGRSILTTQLLVRIVFNSINLENSTMR